MYFLGVNGLIAKEKAKLKKFKKKVKANTGAAVGKLKKARARQRTKLHSKMLNVFNAPKPKDALQNLISADGDAPGPVRLPGADNSKIG